MTLTRRRDCGNHRHGCPPRICSSCQDSREQSVWLGGTPTREGLDIKARIREGLLDSVICQEGVDPKYIRLGEEHGCEFVLFTGYRSEQAMSPDSVNAAYGQGVEHFAYWDMDCAQVFPSAWNWLRRIGHRDEMADWSKFAPKDRLIKPNRVGGVDVTRGLADAVCSGG